MSYWQFTSTLVFCLIAVSLTWPTEEDNTKACAHITSSSNGDAKCQAYCISKNKKGGACQKKKCVCNNNDDDDNDEDNSEEEPRHKRHVSSWPIEFDFCRIYCENLKEFFQHSIKENCNCTRL